MMRSLFSGVSGLKAHQARMDVIGNNISNVNTIGYKSSRVTFQEVFTETIRGAGAPEGGKGGTNPQQIGLGVNIASIDTLHQRGSIERTDYFMDLAIEGNGFFVVSDGTSQKYTRAGNLSRDTYGNIVNCNGFKVMGWMADASGNINTSTPPVAMRIPKDMQLQPQATTKVDVIGNLDPDADIADTIPFEAAIYDQLGRRNKLSFSIEKTGTDTWQVAQVEVIQQGQAPQVIDIVPAVSIAFVDGKIAAGDTFTVPSTAGLIPEDIVVDLSQVNQYSSESGIDPLEVDGYPAGHLEYFSFDANGIATGVFTNGMTKALGRLAMANFNNPPGLQKVGNNLYIQTANSGQPSIGVCGVGGRGTINPGSLEMSNVDISKEFTDMIITQRGFQANSRIITASDEILQELVNMKR
jgi:flagellar hook protein FlgE